MEIEALKKAAEAGGEKERELQEQIEILDEKNGKLNKALNDTMRDSSNKFQNKLQAILEEDPTEMGGSDDGKSQVSHSVANKLSNIFSAGLGKKKAAQKENLPAPNQGQNKLQGQFADIFGNSNFMNKVPQPAQEEEDGTQTHHLSKLTAGMMKDKFKDLTSLNSGKSNTGKDVNSVLRKFS